jgi:hypothetical protein
MIFGSSSQWRGSAAGRLRELSPEFTGQKINGIQNNENHSASIFDGQAMRPALKFLQSAAA